jgi:hypothetical protein
MLSYDFPVQASDCTSLPNLSTGFFLERAERSSFPAEGASIHLVKLMGPASRRLHPIPFCLSC